MSHNKKPKETIYYHYVLVALPNFISAEFGNKLVKGAGIDIACLAYNHKDKLVKLGDEITYHGKKIPFEGVFETNLSDCIVVNFRSSETDLESDWKDIASPVLPCSIRINSESTDSAKRGYGFSKIKFKVIGYTLELCEKGKEYEYSDIHITEAEFCRILKEHRENFENCWHNHRAECTGYGPIKESG